MHSTQFEASVLISSLDGHPQQGTVGFWSKCKRSPSSSGGCDGVVNGGTHAAGNKQ